MLPELSALIPTEGPIGLVAADGANDTRPCHAAIAAQKVKVVIPTRRDRPPRRETTPGAPERNETLNAIRRLRRSIWRSHGAALPNESRIEAETRCPNRLGEPLMARTFDRHTTEL